jgi:ribose transport system permease protein
MPTPSEELAVTQAARTTTHDNAGQAELAGRSAAYAQPRGGATGSGPQRYALLTLLQRYALLIALAALIVLFSVLRPETFFTTANLTTILSIQATAAMLALGVTLVLLIGEFDLSIAAVMGMSASVIAYLTTQQGTPVLIACAAALVASALVGLANALLVVRAGLNSFIVTLAMGTLIQGLAIGVAGSTTIGGLPESLTDAFQMRLLGVQAAFYYMLLTGVLMYLAIGRMPLGRSLFFTGNARAAAELAGVRTGRLRIGVMITAALLAGIAGLMFVGQTGAASPSIADPYLLPAFAAGFLGATAFTPGRFNVWGSLWAVYLLSVGTTGFQFLGLENWVIGFFNGTVLILAVALSKLFARSAKG